MGLSGVCGGGLGGGEGGSGEGVGPHAANARLWFAGAACSYSSLRGASARQTLCTAVLGAGCRKRAVAGCAMPRRADGRRGRRGAGARGGHASETLGAHLLFFEPLGTL